MLSIFNRRITSTLVARPAMMRMYTVVPSTPQQQEPIATTSSNHGVKTSENNFNSVHALYNNENQSIHESHLNSTHGQTYRSLSEDDGHSTFSPTFNSVFDE